MPKVLVEVELSEKHYRDFQREAELRRVTVQSLVQSMAQELVRELEQEELDGNDQAVAP